MPRSLLSIAPLAVALISMLSLPGCGGGGETGETERSQTDPYAGKVYEPSPKFLEILHGLKKAASSDGAYHAVRRAQTLAEVERNVIDEFCTFTFQVRANHEVHLTHGSPAYSFSRIIRYAAYKRRRSFTALVGDALGRLQAIIDPASLRNHQLKHYLKACGTLVPFSPTPWTRGSR